VARASRLRLDAATAEVLRSFDRAGLRALVLKGPSTASWLYGEAEPRAYLDCDLLIAPSDLAAAEEVLESLGYTRHFDARRMPSWWREHATAWVREGDEVTVDLHRTLPGVGVEAEATWLALSADTNIVMVAGYPAPRRGRARRSRAARRARCDRAARTAIGSPQGKSALPATPGHRAGTPRGRW